MQKQQKINQKTLNRKTTGQQQRNSNKKTKTQQNNRKTTKNSGAKTQILAGGNLQAHRKQGCGTAEHAGTCRLGHRKLDNSSASSFTQTQLRRGGLAPQYAEADLHTQW